MSTHPRILLWHLHRLAAPAASASDDGCRPTSNPRSCAAAWVSQAAFFALEIDSRHPRMLSRCFEINGFRQREQRICRDLLDLRNCQRYQP